MVDNYSKITLSFHKKKMEGKVRNLRTSMSLLKDKKSDYYEHHQHVINAYNEVINVLDNFIADCDYIGTGK